MSLDVAKIEVAAPMEFYISSAHFVQSTNFEKWAKQTQIDTLVNVSDFPLSEKLVEYYKTLGITKVIYYPFADDTLTSKDNVITSKNHVTKILSQIYSKLGKRNLVHCTMGINRSALVIAYSLCKSTNFAPKQIVEFIKYYNKKYRNQPALINPSFVQFIEGL